MIVIGTLGAIVLRNVSANHVMPSRQDTYAVLRIVFRYFVE